MPLTKFDEIKDWTYGTVKEVKEGEKKIVLETGEGALFSTPTNGYYIEVWPAGYLPLIAPSIAVGKEVEAFRIEVGGLTGDTFTWTSRKQLGTPERSIQVGDQVCAPLSAEVIEKIQTTINTIENEGVTTSFLASEAVTEAKIKAEAVSAGKIATGAVTETKIGSEAVTAGKIATNAVTSIKIKSEAVTSAKIATEAVTTIKIEAGAVTGGKIAGEAVSEGKILNEAVTESKLGSEAVTNAKVKKESLEPNRLEKEKLVSEQVKLHGLTVDRLKEGEITNAYIASGAGIEESKLADLTGYLKLAGRAGGQKATGGTESGNNLEFTSTSNATKGKITLGANSAYKETFSEVTGKGRALGIGTNEPVASLHVNVTSPTLITSGIASDAQAFTSFEGGTGGKVEGGAAGTFIGGNGSSVAMNSGLGGRARNSVGNATAGKGGFFTFVGAAGAAAECGEGATAKAGDGASFSFLGNSGGFARGYEGAKPKETIGGECGKFSFVQNTGGAGEGGEICKGGTVQVMTFESGKGGTALGEAGFTKTATAAAAAIMRFNGGRGGHAEGGSEKAVAGEGSTLEFLAGAGGKAEGGTVSNTQAKGGSLIFKGGAAGETAETGRVLSTGGEISFAAGEGKNGSPGGPIKFKTYKENETVGAEAEFTAAGRFEVIKGLTTLKEGLTVEGALKSEGAATFAKTVKIKETLTAEGAAVVEKTLKVKETLTAEGAAVVEKTLKVKELLTAEKGLKVEGAASELTLPAESITEGFIKNEAVAKGKLAKAVQEELLKIGKPSAGAAYTSAKEETETKPTFITLLLKCPAEAKLFTCALENGGVAITSAFIGTTTGIQKIPVTFFVEKGGKWKATMTNVTSTEIFRQIVNSV